MNWQSLTGRHPWGVAAALAAFVLGLLILFRSADALGQGSALPHNLLWTPALLALWPLGVASALRLGTPVAGAMLTAVYLVHSFFFGLGFGGMHLTLGVPLVLFAVTTALVEQRRLAAPRQAS